MFGEHLADPLVTFEVAELGGYEHPPMIHLQDDDIPKRRVDPHQVLGVEFGREVVFEGQSEEIS